MVASAGRAKERGTSERRAAERVARRLNFRLFDVPAEFAREHRKEPPYSAVDVAVERGLPEELSEFFRVGIDLGRAAETALIGRLKLVVSGMAVALLELR